MDRLNAASEANGMLSFDDLTESHASLAAPLPSFWVKIEDPAQWLAFDLATFEGIVIDLRDDDPTVIAVQPRR